MDKDKRLAAEKKAMVHFERASNHLQKAETLVGQYINAIERGWVVVAWDLCNRFHRASREMVKMLSKKNHGKR